MKKFISMILLAFAFMSVNAQIPYFSGVPSKGKVYTYTSLKTGLEYSTMETYSTWTYSFTDHIAAGTDMYTWNNSVYLGYTFRFNAFKSKYIGIGAQLTPSFELGNKHQFSYFTGGIYMNGAITDNLFWVSNTWIGINDGADNTYNNWWYLGYYQELNDKWSVTPMLGLIHSWEFNADPTIGLGAYFTYGKFDFYIWGDRFNYNEPRVIVGVDITL